MGDDMRFMLFAQSFICYFDNILALFDVKINGIDSFSKENASKKACAVINH